MEIVRQLDQRLWREYVDHHPRGNIFHTPEMFQVFRHARGHRPELWATIHEGRVLALLLPVQITLMNGLLSRLTTRAVAYGSVLCAPGDESGEALTMMLRAYQRAMKGGPLFTELRNLSDLTDIQPVLNECGFVYQDHLNYLIDLDRPLDQVMQSIKPRTRKYIRQGLREHKVVMEQATSPGQVRVCYDLIQASYIAARMPLADRTLFESAFDVLHPRRMARFSLAQVDATHATTSVELMYKDMIYGWYSGIDRTFANLRVGDLIMWHILKWGVENGYKVYDFGGAGKPNEDYGPRKFKAKFGGQLVNYGRNVCVHSPLLLRLSTWGYRVYRRWRGRVSPTTRGQGGDGPPEADLLLCETRDEKRRL